MTEKVHPIRRPPVHFKDAAPAGYMHPETAMHITRNTLRDIRSGRATQALTQRQDWETIARAAFADMYQLESALDTILDGQPAIIGKKRGEIVFLLDKEQHRLGLPVGMCSKERSE